MFGAFRANTPAFRANIVFLVLNIIIVLPFILNLLFDIVGNDEIFISFV
jgi:hypothetical protein